MWQLIRPFVDVAFRRRGPADFPASQYLLRIVIGAYLLVGMLALLLHYDPLRAVHMALVETLFMLGFLWVVLRLFGGVQMFTQTVIALLGAHALLAVVQIPILMLGRGYEELPAALIIAILVVLFWSVDIGACVVSAAVKQPYAFGLLLMIVHLLGIISLHQYLFAVAS